MIIVGLFHLANKKIIKNKQMKILALIFNKFIYRNIIKRKLKKVGSNFRFGYSSELLNPQFFEIGNNFFTGPYTYFVTNRNHLVTIGNDVMFGPFCKIIGGSHDSKFTKNHMMYNHDIEHAKSEIILENGVWVGSETTILSKAFIGEGAIVGAKSLVNNYIPPYCIAVGNPAKKIIKRFDNKKDLIELLKNVKSKYSFEEINSIYNKFNISY
jgi:acetyltransferase-like isoleucine patch superfamily enzyme